MRSYRSSAERARARTIAQSLACFGTGAHVQLAGRERLGTPRVSVVIPCYNYARYLVACVESVLVQRGVEVEIVIVDDSSTDDSAAVARRISELDSRVRVIEHRENRGHIATYNDGLAEISGEFVLLLSADDLLVRGALARAAALLEANPAVGLVYGNAIDFSTDALPRTEESVSAWLVWPGHRWLETRCRSGRNPVSTPTVVMRTSVLRAVGGYRPELPHAADFELWMRAAAVSDVGFVAGAHQAYYRRHGANMHDADFATLHASGMMLDLRQRWRSFQYLFEQMGEHLPAAREFQRTARRTLARESLGLASRAYTWGLTETWPVADLEAFAHQLYPRMALLPQHWTLAAQQRLGATRADHSPMLVAGEQLHRVTRAAQQWRLETAGL
jgi:glycosyltransferase involved in cell wall biosynthesis